MELLKPLSVCLDRLQSDTATIADSVKEWLIILENQSLNKMPYLHILEKRFSQCVTPAHFLAFMLHPKYNENGLTVDQREKARVWVTEDISNDLKFNQIFIQNLSSKSQC